MFSNGEVPIKRHQRTLSRVHSQRLSTDGSTGDTSLNEEAPPLPPRTSV